MCKQFGMLLLVGALLAGCSTITITPKGEAKLATEPTWQERKKFLFWGLVGEHRVDVKTVCDDTAVRQMQAYNKPTDVVLTIVTLGIYQPRSARVWCGEA